MKKFLIDKNILVLLSVCALISLYFLSPIFIQRGRGIFFSLDPDAHYLGNVISYIKSDQINYINHPATPTIVSYAILLTPLRFFTKLIVHMNFVDWYILHSDIVYLYIRVIQDIVFGLGLFIFSLSIYCLTRSLIISVSSIFSLFTFNFFVDIALHIRSETTSFLIIAIWLLVFVSFIKSKKILPNLILAIIAGLAIANKFTNIFYFFSTLALIPFIANVSRKTKILMLTMDSLTAITSFIFFTWPIREKYNQILQYILNVFPQTGVSPKIDSLLNISAYFAGIYFFISKEPFAAIVIILTFILLFYLYFFRKTKISSSICSFAFIMFSGLIIFARFPLNYYQLTHFVGILFVFHILLQISKKTVHIILFGIFFLICIQHLWLYYPQTMNLMSNSKNLDKFVSDHPSKYGTIWERGDAKDFALLWGNSWSGSGYSTNLAKLRPDLLFEIYFQQNYVGDRQNLFTICWDQFYMQKDYLDRFIEKYKNNHFTYSSIPATANMYLVERKDCEP